MNDFDDIEEEDQKQGRQLSTQYLNQCGVVQELRMRNTVSCKG